MSDWSAQQMTDMARLAAQEDAREALASVLGALASHNVRDSDLGTPFKLK
jgi:hypothetical protein